MVDSAVCNQILTFMLGEDVFGIEINKVSEILTYTIVTTIPDSTQWVKGVINLRGEVVPIIDLRIRFHINMTPEYSDRTIIIAVKTNDNRIIGLVVDSVSEMETIEIENLFPAPEMGTSISPAYLKGLFKQEEKMVVVFDIERILDIEEMEKLSRICDELDGDVYNKTA